LELLGFEGIEDGLIEVEPTGATAFVAPPGTGKTRLCHLIEALAGELTGRSNGINLRHLGRAKASITWAFSPEEETFVPRDAHRVTELFIGDHQQRRGSHTPDAAASLARRFGYRTVRVDAETGAKLPDALRDMLIDHLLGFGQRDGVQRWLDCVAAYSPVRANGVTRQGRTIEPNFTFDGQSRTFDALPRTARKLAVMLGLLLASDCHLVLVDDAEEVLSGSLASVLAGVESATAQVLLFGQDEQLWGRQRRLKLGTHGGDRVPFL
jgi:hypothetical protein